MGFFSKLKEKVFGKSNARSEKYVAALDKSRSNFSTKLNALAARYREINEDYFDELEEILIEADIGVKIVMEIIEETKKEVRLEKIKTTTDINETLVDKMFVYYAKGGEEMDTEIKMNENGPTVILMVGVNGVGKTTSIAKLAYRFKNEGKKVLLVAGDTFRAGAVEQLDVWASRLGVEIVKGNDKEDPSSVYYRGVNKAKEDGYDIVICDSAGRLQTKTNLMDELSKMRRVLSKEVEGAPHEVMLVIDATTGQNGVIQASSFAKATGVDSIILTKMDSTSKGGIILSIREELGIPVKYIGLGEKLDDLEEFDLEEYIYGLCMNMEGDK
ncbi:MAG: signal recognition particle-docking protein FtsY [Bacilli bacterium]|nr:signal recognition particle-docking protein FtsY [Bacilli bacterium]